MNRLLLIAILSAVALATRAAQPAEELSPAVNTSAEPESSAPVPSATPPAAAATGKARKGLMPKQDAAAAPAAKPGGPVELDPTQITGNRELPKVMYVVPWKRPSLGDYPGQPPNSLLDEVLSPVDRDVFKRQNRYFEALQPDAKAAPAGANSTPVTGDEK
ncbi:MAG: hypothetical protein ABSE43_10165 [Steroidobacteraceae bacterium]|jgi:hypothetical protein